MSRVEALLDLVIGLAKEVAALPRQEQELALVSIWSANEDAGRTAGLTREHARLLEENWMTGSERRSA